ncbi:MAG: molybdate ABC transporter substrate-binding protein [Betaproteobacteria bacterium]|nr:molybdate ABC transporter substrate-binding protein [Betaproteobacteria bacterium]
MVRTAVALLLVGWVLPMPVGAAEVHVAVAANFTAPMQKLAGMFERQTGHRVAASFGSTGKLATQIQNGAPFEVFLAADDETPAKLERSGHAVSGSRVTYAIGRLVLWSRESGRVDGDGAVLRGSTVDRLAIATLRALGLYERLQPRLVTGENITQAHQFVATGNAPLGFVALSQVQVDGRITEGSAWLVPARLHEPIVQQAVLLNPGRDSPAAAAFIGFLRSEPVRAVIRGAGYDTPPE